MTTDTQRLAHLETDVAVLKTDVAEIKTTVARLDVTMTDIKDLLKTLAPMLIASNARSEEQSKRIDDLSRSVAANSRCEEQSKRIDDLSRAVAANTPQQIAAVPAAGAR